MWFKIINRIVYLRGEKPINKKYKLFYMCIKCFTVSCI